MVSSDAKSSSSDDSSASSHGNGHKFLKFLNKKKPEDAKSRNNKQNGQCDDGSCSFAVGIAEDKNERCRRTMEDAHTYIYNFGDNTDDGYFAVFDGHAGRQAAEWSSKRLHLLVDSAIKSGGHDTVSHALNKAFTEADEQMGRQGLQNSGCTAAVAIMRWEKDGEKRRRMLYVANVGDTRVILCRKGTALRLSYDHKGSDLHEQKRVQNSGGIMINNRVNGVLAVTRSLGDNYMKELVSGSPYTTETELCGDDEFIIVACDGLWDVCDDAKAVETIRGIEDPTEASQALVDYALQHFSSDNLTCMVIRLDQSVF
ncbi:protein phosphatase 2C homolog 1 [Trichomonascus vanleenenianus]|uniref:type 2C protein phosphatase PTC1 n=1 Tax=Trichomonascus vanleenenianus TaxID=2268995 RepID=UPI003EC9DA33